MSVAGTVTMPDVGERLHYARERILAAGGDADRITIVAVTKGFAVDRVDAAAAAGLVDVAENYAAELEAKAAASASTSASGLRGPNAMTVRWHMLGHVQRNKVRRIAGTVYLWQGVDRLAAGAEIAKRSSGARVLVQVNMSGEPARNGCAIDDASALVDGLRALELDVRGLMTVGPTGPPEEARLGFRRLTALADEMGLRERSMGMTDDLEVAVQEGTTMVRLGRALFGERGSAPDRRR